ncbi:MAG: MerR family transcriptional regulator [Candidatus Omnitrophica bacterium]|nr:MerR family transcriptional regulator [Candidatus Omnitrophota bacterium]
MVLYDRDGKVVKIYPYGSEEQLRWQMALEIIFEADQKYFEYLWNKKKQEEKEVKQIIDQPDKKIIRRAEKREVKRYNLTQAAKIIRVSRQGLYYWITKGLIKPRRDYRNYPVFTVFDIEKIIKWRNSIK